MKKILAAGLGFLLLVIGGGFAWLSFRTPNSVPPQDLKIEATPARLERGKYLFEVMADCSGCHSPRNFTRFSGPTIAGKMGSGFAFPREMGLPGDIVAPNLTPDPETGLGTWTDGEKVRAIREGVSKDGRALFPFMPYPMYRQMSDEDVYSLVVYMNSLTPIPNKLPQTKVNFPVNLFIKGVPQPVDGRVSVPDISNREKYGEYLVSMSGCADCHTPKNNKGEPFPDLLYAGGFEFVIGRLSVRSANITPEVDTGIGSWSEQRFVDKFKGLSHLTAETAPVMTQENFTIMPWLALSRAHEEDLRAIYRFLRTIKPVRNEVDPHKPLMSR